MTAEEIRDAANEFGRLHGEMQGMIDEYLAGGKLVPGFGKLDYDAADIIALMQQFASHRIQIKSILDSITPLD